MWSRSVLRVRAGRPHQGNWQTRSRSSTWSAMTCGTSWASTAASSARSSTGRTRIRAPGASWVSQRSIAARETGPQVAVADHRPAPDSQEPRQCRAGAGAGAGAIVMPSSPQARREVQVEVDDERATRDRTTASGAATRDPGLGVDGRVGLGRGGHVEGVLRVGQDADRLGATHGQRVVVTQGAEGRGDVGHRQLERLGVGRVDEGVDARQPAPALRVLDGAAVGADPDSPSLGGVLGPIGRQVGVVAQDRGLDGPRDPHDPDPPGDLVERRGRRSAPPRR